LREKIPFSNLDNFCEFENGLMENFGIFAMGLIG
jgi:hypothetical protein